MNGLLRDGQDWLPQLLHGALLSVEITVITMILSVIWGLLLGIARIAKIPVLQQLLIVYVEIFRGLPTIVILFVAYFGLPTVGFSISNSPMVVGIIALTLNMGAYLSEVFRAAILAIDPGQMKAAESLGMSRLQGYCRIVLPQALLVAVPTLGSFFVGLIKDTSLLSFISVRELLEVGNEINAATFQSFQVYFYVGLIYIVLSLIASRLVLFTESRLRPMDRRRSRLDRPEKLQSELPATMQVLT
jgi:His/Glu/Gln/Arg/opine family amino acid ABC transporter permease subunit